MIIPFMHEDMSSRRWPVVTFALMALNIVCLVVLSVATAGDGKRINALADDALAFRDSHPLVADSCAPLADVPRPPPPKAPSTIVSARPVRGGRAGAAPVVDPLAVAREQEALARDQDEYGRLCTQLVDAITDQPVYRYGYVPAKNNVLGLVTHQFLHGGWLHLLSNLWFLFLCGCNVEDRWGRAVFLPFYLSAGVVAALLEKLVSPSSAVPLIGASGAIAGAMGAFLVTFANTRIRFAYALFFRFGTFRARAYVMLPLWLLSELFWGFAGAGDGVAHWAHIGGFVYGVAFAFALDKRLARRLDDAMDRAATTLQDPRIVRAGDLINAGAATEAIAILSPLAQQQPRNIDVQLELLRAAKAVADPARERAAYAKLIELYFETGAPDTAADLYEEMVPLGYHRELTRAWTLRVAENLASRALFDRAAAAYATACHDGVVDVASMRATVAHGKVALRLGQTAKARALFAEARASSFATPEVGAAIDAELARTGASA